MIYHWIYVSFFLLSPTLLFSAEVKLPTQKDVTEALQTIGKFLKDDGGPAWLSSLVTKQSEPLTTDDLMNEILNTSKANENVKQAANIIKLALGELKQPGTNKTLVLEFDVWKDMIDNVEQQEDIVCLYRRSYNATNERSEDWQKFLNNISPNHTIYLALDMGHKYVICLKKVKELERNITNRNLDSRNDTASNSNDTLTNNSGITGENEVSSGSRSMSHGDTSMKNDNDKCESPDMRSGYNGYSRSMPAYMDFGRRTLPTQNYDSPCNRPIIVMLPPNYMPIMSGYNTPVWPRNAYQVTPNPFRSQPMPPYQSRIPWLPSSPVYSYPIDKYKHMYDYGRKQLSAPPRSSQESQEENKRTSQNYDLRNALANSRENIPRQTVRAGQFQPSFRPTFPYMKPAISPMARSFPHPWPSARPQLENGNRQFMFPSIPMSPQIGRMGPPFYRNPLPSRPSSLLPSQQNCMSCTNPCDRPILLKVLVENPVNQPVKIGLMHSREIDDGRRRMTEGAPERETGSMDEKNGETAEENGDKEIG